MIFGRARVISQFIRCLLSYLRGHDPQRLAGLQRPNVGLSCPFKIEKLKQRIRHRCPNCQYAMVTHHQNGGVGVSEQGRTARAFLLEGQTPELVIDHVASVEHGGILVDGGQCAIGQRSQHSGVDRMHVHDTAGMGAVAMYRTVQTPGGGIRGVGGSHGIAVVGVQK